MIKANKHRELLDFHRSYFYQQQRRNKRKRWAIVTFSLLIVVLLPLAFISIAFANDNISAQQGELQNTENREFHHGPQLTFNHPNPVMRIAMPVDLTASIEINGLMSVTELTQVFINPHDITLEGKYQFPLPENAAVSFMQIHIGSRVIEGKIMEKQAARKVYQQAKRSGKKASLVAQQRPNVFTNRIANIPGNSKVIIKLRLITPVTYQHGRMSLSLPLAMTPRYLPASFENSPAEQDSHFLTAETESLASSQATIIISLNAGTEVKSVASPSHAINIQALNAANSQYRVTLDKQSIAANKRFVLTWQLSPSQQPSISSFVERNGDSYYTLLTFFPGEQTSQAPIARDVIFIIDTSGSMQGASIEQAKASLIHALSLLNKTDSFNIIAFNNYSVSLFKRTAFVSANSIEQAKRFIRGLRADGGTEMYRPLSQALMMAKSNEQTKQAVRQIVFITDGAVANEFELMKLLEQHSQHKNNDFRLFTVGIGSAPNGYFMKKAAQFGRGSYVFIQNTQEVAEKIAQLMTKISQPVLSNLALMFDQQVHHQLDVYPQQLPDLYQGEPLQVAIKSSLPINSVQALGDTASTAWYRQLIVEQASNSQGIATIWARRKIADLVGSLVRGADRQQVKAQVIETSIAHQIISPYTSFIAVEKTPERALFARHNSEMSQLGQLAENLQVAMPKTALGWQGQLLLSLAILLVSYLLLLVYRPRHD